ncbi:MAG: hypothetical protein FJ296_08905 [Planctomycetes bacterium]|nr:hypothetical protein [Planctomycetota bacterium]
MGASFRQLRERCQLPVRAHNDVAGLLFGDWASLPLTKLFVDGGWSPNVATLGMLVCGLAGAALQVAGGWWALAGAVLLVLYYVLDCVDGEVARWHGVEDMRWGYYDTIFHLLVKPATFLGAAIGCWRALGHAELLILGAIAAVAVLWLKMFLQLPGILFLHDVLNGQPGGSRAFRRFLQSLDSKGPGVSEAEAGGNGGATVAAGPSASDARPVVPRPRFPLGLNLVTLRAFLTNFDIGLLLLVAACVVDLARPTFELGGFEPLSARALWLAYYGVVLPLDFLDYVRTYVARGHLARETTRLADLAHRYRQEGEREVEPTLKS